MKLTVISQKNGVIHFNDGSKVAGSVADNSGFLPF